jgi:hypothetical protein
MNKLLTAMSAENKQIKKEQEKLELRIKKALSKFTAAVKSKKLEKKVKKYSAELAALIVKHKEPAAKAKSKKAKPKSAAVKQEKKSAIVVEK